MGLRVFGKSIFVLIQVSSTLAYAQSNEKLSGKTGANTKVTASKASSELVGAQNMFLRTDFEGALKATLAILKKSSQNIEAKRLAAKSYRELKRFKECLRMAQSIPPQPSFNEDVILVGDCNQQDAVWTLNFLQSATLSPTARDSALFFIGKYYYKQGDYQKSAKNLQDSVILPARLDKERTFMLERIRDVVQSQNLQQQNIQKTEANTPLAPAEKPSTPHLADAKDTRETKEDLRENLRENSRENPKENTRESAKDFKSADNNDNDTQNSLYDAQNQTLFGSGHARSFSFFAGGAAEFGKEVSLKRGTQTEFENTVETGASGSSGAFRAIKTTQSSSIYPLVLTSGFLRLGTNRFEKNQFFGFGLEIFGEAAYGKRTVDFVLPHIAHANFGTLLPYKHITSKIAPIVGIQPNRFFLLSLGVPVGFASTLKTFSVSQSPTLTASLAAGLFKISVDYQYSLVQGSDFKLGAHTSCYGFKLGISGSHVPIALATDSHTFRFCQIRPDGSKNIVEFTELEGDYLELNLNPRMKFSQDFELGALLRYSSSTLGSYVSTSQAKRVEERGKNTKNFAPFRPSSGMTSSNIEVSTLANLRLFKSFLSVAKVGYRSFDSVYSEAASGGNSEAILYADLLDAGMLKKAFVSLGMQLDFSN